MIHSSRFFLSVCIAILLLIASAGFVSAAQVPMITSLAPSGGPVAGGTVVTITGSGFIGTKDVLFGGKSANGLSVISDSELRVITPRHAEERVLVSIITDEGVPGPMEPFTMFSYSYEESPLARPAGEPSGSRDPGSPAQKKFCSERNPA